MSEENLDVKLYTVKDIERIFHCKKSKAYQIMKSRNFPSMKIGRNVYVTHDNLVKYIKQNNRANIIIK